MAVVRRLAEIEDYDTAGAALRRAAALPAEEVVAVVRSYSEMVARARTADTRSITRSDARRAYSADACAAMMNEGTG